MRSIACASVVLALVGACTPFAGSTDAERDAARVDADADAGAAPDDGAAFDGSSVDASGDARVGYACTPRPSQDFASRSACEAASASAAPGCVADAGMPKNGDPCMASLTWCACVDSSIDTTVSLHVLDCSCAP